MRIFKICFFATLMLGIAPVAGFGPALVMAAEDKQVAMITPQKMGVTGNTSVASRRFTVSDKPMGQTAALNINLPKRVVADISPAQVLAGGDVGGFTGMTSNKVRELGADLFKLQNDIARLSDQVLRMELDSQQKAAEYYASVATINTQLQTGTTKGNPRLVAKLDVARRNLDSLSESVSAFNSMAIEVGNRASVSSFILDNIRAAYGLSGSTEEDHAQLAQLEDAVLGNSVVVERLLNNINDDISRSAAYLSAERSNMRTLSLAVSNGELYGRSLSNRPFANVPQSELASRFQSYGLNSNGGGLTAAAPLPAPGGLTGGPLILNAESTQEAISTLNAPQQQQPGQPRPLMTIRFDKPNVAYQQPLYVAINEAMNMYPGAQFELVAVAPGQGNAAKMAIENSRSRRNAEQVLRDMTSMGIQAEKVILSASSNPNSDTSEVQLYVR